MKKLISAVLLVCMFALVLTSCSSLPKEMSGETMAQPSTFMKKTTGDADIDNIIKKVTVAAAFALDDLYVGYSESDKTIYLVNYTSLSKYGHAGIDYSDIIPAVEGIAEEISKNVDFKGYHFGIITVDGHEYNSELDILFIVKDGKVVKNYTSW